ncbi:MAG: gluconate 2-dehydrogenase subunit 3 family protein [Adhaeribacter sp.]
MKRRAALKHLSLALAGLVSLPAWAQTWSPASLGPITGFQASEQELLAEIVETIIPQTDTPGAKALQVHQFALRMIQDCYGEAAQASLAQGLAAVNQIAQGAFSKDFMALDTSQRTAVLGHMHKSEVKGEKQFVDLIKGLTIRGYLNSEYVQLNLSGYNMAPGFYHGCVPLKS